MKADGTFVRGTAMGVAALGISLALTLSALASDNKIALIPGGPHPYFAPWAQAAADAKKDFGIAAVDFKVPTDWKLNLQTELIESLAAQGYTAFGIFPGDAVGINSTISELKGNNIPAAALAGCAQDPTDAVFCLGTDVYNSAYLGTKELIKAMGGSGNIVHFTGLFADSNTQLRIKAVEDAVAETGGKVKLVQTIADIDSPQPADEKINAYLASQGAKTDGIISTAWIPSVVGSTSLRNIGDKRIKMVAIDHDPIVLAAIKDGFINGTMLQNPYGQAYLGSYVLDKVLNGCKFKDNAPFAKTAQTARFIDTGTLFIGADQVDKYVDGLKALTDQLRAKLDSDYLSCS